MNFQEIEKKWQTYWEEHKSFQAIDGSNKPPYYILVEFPYPSGSGLHVGHVRSYTAQDAIARMKRLQGENVLFPMGWDAFGAPAEQYAIKNHIHPKEAVKENIKTFKRQMKTLGFSFDWDREFSTTDPEYYKWTQWQFLQFYKHDMAYKATVPVNWCPNCKTVLSNEDAAGGVCERCGTKVVQKNKSQWMLRMSDYAEDLLAGLDDTHFAPKVKLGQINWIGKSVGAEVDFKVDGFDEKFTVFTTRCDTLFGATYCVLSPEHPLVNKITSKEKEEEVKKYQEECSLKNEMERTELNKEKTGVFIGAYAINPVNNKKIPIYISDYVLASYGTGAIMAVPAHDSRDHAFAKKFNIPIIQVLKGENELVNIEENAYEGDGIHINSGFLDGLNKEEAINKMLEYLEENNYGKKKVNYKMRDWIFSRQRFWGEPIPMIYCEHCGWVPMNESDLPLLLPDVAEYEPTDNGESPLAKITDWVNTTCPKCGAPSKRETDTMPNWAGSSWYFLRFMDPHNKEEFASMKNMKYWNKVNWYNGGMEHVTRHMIYSRFWHHFLYDLGVVNTPEPYAKRSIQGLILGPDGDKMSKSKGNVVDPLDIVEEYGADTLRTYVLFMGDYGAATPWSDSSVKGCKKFLDRVAGLTDILSEEPVSEELEMKIHRTIKKVSSDIENLKFNTAIASLMTLINEITAEGHIGKEDLSIFIKLLSPFAPHLCEEIWEFLGGEGLLAVAPWPVYDEGKTVAKTVEIGVQVNGKVRGTVVLPNGCDKEKAFEIAKADERIASFLEGKNLIKEIYVPNKIVNFVAK